mmetsp:Transcript_11450/g.36387  ORF Transcript_11450/g.36387 Transcript_11450/m.36387 type:complete len:208 (-) Transcript_11450:2632-3255(-)
MASPPSPAPSGALLLLLLSLSSSASSRSASNSNGSGISGASSPSSPSLSAATASAFAASPSASFPSPAASPPALRPINSSGSSALLSRSTTMPVATPRGAISEYRSSTVKSRTAYCFGTARAGLCRISKDGSSSAFCSPSSFSSLARSALDSIRLAEALEPLALVVPSASSAAVSMASAAPASATRRVACAFFSRSSLAFSRSSSFS